MLQSRSTRLHALECRIAEAQLDLARVRRASLPVRGRLETEPAAARGFCASFCALTATSAARSHDASLRCAYFDAALPPAGKTAEGKIPEQSQLG